jgi:hypothetical protein
MIVDPDGLLLAGPVAEREATLFAEIDPGRATGLRWIFDAAGHYNRSDLFSFSMRGAAPPAGPSAPAAKRSRARRPSPAAAKKRPARAPRAAAKPKKRRRG